MKLANFVMEDLHLSTPVSCNSRSTGSSLPQSHLSAKNSQAHLVVDVPEDVRSVYRFDKRLDMGGESVSRRRAVSQSITMRFSLGFVPCASGTWTRFLS
jgi:hypothetical protein